MSNLKDTYFHILIFQEHRRFLRFIESHMHYQFAALPFDLSAALQVFIKCMAVTAFLRRQGIQVYSYLDNWLVRGHTKSQVASNIKLNQSVFQGLGLLINTQNSTLFPLKGQSLLE